MTHLTMTDADLAAARSVLFVSPRGIGRSQMAAAYLRALTHGTHAVETAGVAPHPASMAPVHNEAFMVMGLDQAAFDPRPSPQQISADLMQRADVVVRIGCPDAFRVPAHIPVRDWDVPDPVGAGMATAWDIRDEIKRRVEELAAELGLAHRSLALRDRAIPGQRQVLATGRAATPYPPFGDGESESEWMFSHAEARVLVEVVDAPERAVAINARGPQRPNFDVPWVISAGAASSALTKELEWRSMGSPRMASAEEAVSRVVDWLVGLGALRPLTDAQRLELQRSGRAQRHLDDPPEQWPLGLAGEYPAMAEVRAAEEDLATWEVLPDRMLAVYPDLALEGTSWTDATRAER